MENKKVALLILDGWGYGNNDASNAVLAADTPFFDYCLAHYPNSKLQASGENVGLPDGQMGNSEVGHINLGAGRVVYQELGRINKAVKEGDFNTNPTLQNAFNYAKTHNKKVHLMGLLSDGGVHSHTLHVKGLYTAALNAGLQNIYIHAFLDGRDTDPNSGLTYIETLQNDIQNTSVKIATVIGRYYAMDRDNRWERVKLAYDVMVNGIGETSANVYESIKKSYTNGITDEFMQPMVIDTEGLIQADDVVICFNFRTDRGREITQALSQKDFPDYDMKKLPLHYITMTTYDDTYQNVNVVFTKDDLVNTLGEVLERNHKNQIRIAETEKYPHVTFFFSGGREKEFINERRIMVQSPKVATYDLQPEMSANGIKEAIISEIENGWADFICLNFANPDMVGHTGVFNAVIKAVETVDACAKAVVEAGQKNGYSFIIIADHGNADFMVNADGSANTAHTTNLVPCIVIDTDYKHVNDGKLGDIAPTILKIMGLSAPVEMGGNVLV